MSSQHESNQQGEVAVLDAVVRGRVHNVGFRMFVYQRARSLGLGGYVRNAPEHTVEVHAIGPHPEIDQLLRDLWRGPSAARVTGVDYSWHDAGSADLPPVFEVRP